jgi:hypothetical protein
MKEPSPKRSKQRLRHHRGDRERRIRLLILRGLISDASAIPEDSIPIDPDCSILVGHRSRACFYQDIKFKCSDCNRTEVWSAESQQYYFEVMRSSAYKKAKRCYACRQKIQSQPRSKAAE